MRPADLLARVAGHGFRVEVTTNGPQLVREVGDGALPPQLLSDLKDNRDGVVRHLLLSAVLARAGETRRPAWGIDPEDGVPRKLAAGKKVPGAVELVCVDGDAEWVRLPRESP